MRAIDEQIGGGGADAMYHRGYVPGSNWWESQLALYFYTNLELGDDPDNLGKE